jgi:hypothetical protein
MARDTEADDRTLIRQARRGSRDAIAALVPYGVGFIIYLISRLPMPKPCSACGAVEFTTYPFCHSCGGRRSRQCPACGKPVEAGWKACAHCGKMLSPLAAPSPD